MKDKWIFKEWIENQCTQMAEGESKFDSGDMWMENRQDQSIGL